MPDESILLPILKNLQNVQTNVLNGQTDIKNSMENLRTDLNMQLAAINAKLSGQLISEMEFRQELSELRDRLQRVERRLDLR